jgi:tetratricopeptide (TPR) repeat protein
VPPATTRPGEPGSHRFGALALERGLITPAQLDQALAAQRTSPQRPQLGEVLTGLGFLSAERVAEVLRVQAGRRERDEPGDPLVGETLGGCLILGPLGRGGTGTTYRARHLGLDRDVAVKVLDAELARDDRSVARFRREARTVGRLEHPNLVTVFDLGQEGARLFIVMQLVEGHSLAERLREGPLPLAEALRMALQLARALRAAHDVGVVHRDVKPANVLIRRDGRVKLTDFGLARAPNEAPLENGWEVVGTPLYMAPEQALGGEVGPAADQYALGALLFHALRGEVPFAGEKVIDVLRQQVEAPPPPLTGVPAGVAQLVGRLLAKAPEDRLADCGQLVEELKRLLAGLEVGSISSDELPALPRRARQSGSGATPARPTARAHLEALVVKVLVGDVGQALADLQQLEADLAASLAERIFATLWQVGRLDELARLGDVASGWPRACVYVARALNALHRPEEALAALSTAEALDPDALTERVLASLSLGRRGDAIRVLEEAAANPEPELLERVAKLLCDQLDDLAGAAAVLGRVAVLQPHDSRARRQQGLLLLDDDRFEHAEIALEDAVQRDAHDVRAWALLGRARERQGDREGAASAYRTVLAIEPDRPAVRVSLARLLVDDGRGAEADQLVGEGLELDPEHPGLVELQGALPSRQGPSGP